MDAFTGKFNKFVTAAVAAAASAMIAAAPVAAFDVSKFSAGFGTAENAVMYNNQKVAGFEDPFAGGPNGFAVTGERVAVLDTFNRVVKIFDEAGKALEIIDMKKLLPEASNMFLSHVAVRGNDFLISDTANGKVYVLSGKKVVATLGSKGEKAFELTQAEDVVAGDGGAVAVCDRGKNKICVFAEDGKGIVEHSWSGNGIYIAKGCIYSVDRHANGVFSIYRTPVAKPAPETLVTVQNPSWRHGKLIAVDENGNFIMAFFDDRLQEKLMAAAPEKAPHGYYTVALISPNGQVRETATVPVTTPVGNQFHYSPAEKKLYYQNFNADEAPAGKYSISSVAFAGEFSASAKKLTPEEIISIKKGVTGIEYGEGNNKLAGDFQSVSEYLPIIRADREGCFYILDRIAGKIICAGPNNSPAKTIDAAACIKGFASGAKVPRIDDFYASSSAEITLLSSDAGAFFKLAAKEGGNSFDVKKYSFAVSDYRGYDRVAAGALGETMLYSTRDGRAAYYDASGKPAKGPKDPVVPTFRVLPNSDIVSVAANSPAGTASVGYSDFYHNALERFEKTPSHTAAPEKIISAAHVFGADANMNTFVTLFDGECQNILIYSVTGDPVCIIKGVFPQLPGYFESSLCAGPDGTIYIGAPTPEKYHVIKIPYAYVIDFIKADHLKKKK